MKTDSNQLLASVMKFLAHQGGRVVPHLPKDLCCAAAKFLEALIADPNLRDDYLQVVRSLADNSWSDLTITPLERLGVDLDAIEDRGFGICSPEQLANIVLSADSITFLADRLDDKVPYWVATELACRVGHREFGDMTRWAPTAA